MKRPQLKTPDAVIQPPELILPKRASRRKSVDKVLVEGIMKNARHEAVVQAFIFDPTRTGWRAYQAIYPNAKRHTCETAWSQLMKKEEFRNRIIALTSLAAGDKVMKAGEVLERLTVLARSNMADYMRPGKHGEPVLDFSRLTREQTAALQEVTVEEFKDGRSDQREVRRIRFKLVEKRGPLELLGKHHGLFAEKVNHEHQHEHTIFMGELLKEIDRSNRDIVTIEHQPAD